MYNIIYSYSFNTIIIEFRYQISKGKDKKNYGFHNVLLQFSILLLKMGRNDFQVFDFKCGDHHHTTLTSLLLWGNSLMTSTISKKVLLFIEILSSSRYFDFLTKDKFASDYDLKNGLSDLYD